MSEVYAAAKASRSGAGNRPGYRTAQVDAAVLDARAVAHQAHQDHLDYLNNAWRGQKSDQRQLRDGIVKLTDEVTRLKYLADASFTVTDANGGTNFHRAGWRISDIALEAEFKQASRDAYEAELQLRWSKPDPNSDDDDTDTDTDGDDIASVARSVANAVAAATNAPVAFATPADGAVHDSRSHQQRMSEIYAAQDAALSQEYRHGGKTVRDACSVRPAPITARRTTVDEAYAQYQAELSQAWKNPPSE